MAARATRAFSAAQGDFYVCPLPQLPWAADKLDEALEALWRGEHVLIPVVRERQDGTPERLAEGSDYQGPMRVEAAGQLQHWTERRLVVRSLRQAQAAALALRARVAKAMAQIEALHHRGRGKKRFEEVAVWRQAVGAIVQRYRVEECWWLRYPQHTTPRAVRACRDRPARIEAERQAPVEVRVDEAALEAAVRRLGWRVYGTHQPQEQWPLAQAVLAYRSAYLVERSLGRLKGCPLALTPRYVQRDDQATGLIRLWSIALRVLTLLECVGRRQLAAHGATLAGLYAGNTQRTTAHPTAERLLAALQEITLTIMEGPQQTYHHVTALSPLQHRILEVLGFSSEPYTRLCTISSEPP